MAKKRRDVKEPATMFWTCRHCNRLNCILTVDMKKEVTTTCLGCGRQVHVMPTEMKDALANDETMTPVGE